jgi:cation transport regulator ChaC
LFWFTQGVSASQNSRAITSVQHGDEKKVLGKVLGDAKINAPGLLELKSNVNCEGVAFRTPPVTDTAELPSFTSEGK